MIASLLLLRVSVVCHCALARSQLNAEAVAHAEKQRTGRRQQLLDSDKRALQFHNLPTDQVRSEFAANTLLDFVSHTHANTRTRHRLTARSTHRPTHAFDATRSDAKSHAHSFMNGWMMDGCVRACACVRVRQWSVQSSRQFEANVKELLTIAAKFDLPRYLPRAPGATSSGAKA